MANSIGAIPMERLQSNIARIDVPRPPMCRRRSRISSTLSESEPVAIMEGIPVDSDSRVVEVRYAVVYAPRRSRGRFAETCVHLVASDVDALEQADPANNYFAATVIGPSKSSEGQRIYYLDDWLG